MRSVSLALMLVTFGTVCDAAQKASWHSYSSEGRATLAYGIDGTDDVGFHVSCNRDSGSIELIPSLREVGLKAGEKAKVGLSTKDDRIEFAGEVFLNEATGENNILVKADSTRALRGLFLKAGVLTISLPKDRHTLPIGPRAIASFASFKRDCSPSDPAAGKQK